MIDVGGSFSKFATQDCPPPETFDDAGLAAWLDVLRGRRSAAWIGTAVGRSRSRVSRWLSGQTRPRLPDFLRLVDALTGRLEVVDVEAVPSLASRWRRKQLEREVALTHPWTEAMLRLLETTTYQRLEGAGGGTNRPEPLVDAGTSWSRAVLHPRRGRRSRGVRPQPSVRHPVHLVTRVTPPPPSRTHASAQASLFPRLPQGTALLVVDGLVAWAGDPTQVDQALAHLPE